MNNMWHLVLSGILFLLLNSCMANNDLSCGQVFANYINSNNVKSGNFEAFMRQLVPKTQTKVAGKACGSAARFVHYLMHQKNIGNIKNSSQLKQDIENFARINTTEDQATEKISQVLNNEFLQNKDDDVPRTAVCFFRQKFKQSGEMYEFPGTNHVFVIEKGGKNEFRLWQSWIQYFSVLEWVQGQIEGETEPKDITYTHRERPLSREEAEHLINDLITFSDSDLDWNKRENLSSKMFWSTKNLFEDYFSLKYKYFDSNGRVSNISSCDNAYSTDYSQLRKHIQTYLDDPNNLKEVEEKRIASRAYCGTNTSSWLLFCDENQFSAAHASIIHTYKKCYSDISKNIDLSNVPNLPKVEILMNCQVTTNPNNGAQCHNLITDIYKILRENPQ